MAERVFRYSLRDPISSLFSDNIERSLWHQNLFTENYLQILYFQLKLFLGIRGNMIQDKELSRKYFSKS